MKPYYDKDGITIYHGSCLDVLPTLDAVDHVITDPPYARDVYLRMRGPNSSGSARTEAVSLQAMRAGAIGDIDAILDEVACVIGRMTKRWAIVFSDAETTWRWRDQMTAAGMRYIRTGAWVKPDAMPQMSGDRPGVGFEPCTIAHAQGPMRWNGGGQAAVWTYNTVKGTQRPDHPCPKPLPLMREIVDLFTDPSDIILDPFMGSGTTLVAAKEAGRRAIGIELEEKYCAIAKKRLVSTAYKPGLFTSPRKEATKQEALL